VGGQYKPDQPQARGGKDRLCAPSSARPSPMCWPSRKWAPHRFLEELRSNLAKEGLNYPYATLVDGPDPDRMSRAAVALKAGKKIIPHETNRL